MKTARIHIKNPIERASTILLFVLVVILFASCEHRLDSRTRVHADGHIERTFTRESKDSAGVDPDYLGLSRLNGWALDTPFRVSDERYKITHRKTFPSAEASNEELDRETRDSLLRIHSQFEKKFRWFYTYYEYAETLRALNRFTLPVTDYLTDQDFQFIEQLPAEGKPISKADSLFLESLKERIYDSYAMRAYFEAFFELIVQEEKNAQRQAAIRANRDAVFTLMERDSSVNDEDHLNVLALRMGVDTAVLSSESFQRKSQLLEGQLSFMAWAADGRYQHEIEMPGTVMSTNADTVVQQLLRWSPSALKFHFRDYTMRATSRQPNYWAWAVSAAIGVIAVGLGVRRKK
jgi:hypothetical protein